MTATDSNGGSVLPLSQLRTVQQFTPRSLAASLWVSSRMRRQCPTCWPKVCGSKSVSFGFRDLSRIDGNCKRATRPRPCGYLGHWTQRCPCTPDQVKRYRGKISGPFLDRIDLHVEVPALRDGELERARTGDATTAIRERASRARETQLERQGKPNARLAGGEIERHCGPDAAGQALLRDAASRLGLSARAFHRVLKVARTIADLDQMKGLAARHIAEALQYRAAGP